MPYCSILATSCRTHGLGVIRKKQARQKLITKSDPDILLCALRQDGTLKQQVIKLTDEAAQESVKLDTAEHEAASLRELIVEVLLSFGFNIDIQSGLSRDGYSNLCEHHRGTAPTRQDLHQQRLRK